MYSTLSSIPGKFVNLTLGALFPEHPTIEQDLLDKVRQSVKEEDKKTFSRLTKSFLPADLAEIAMLLPETLTLPFFRVLDEEVRPIFLHALRYDLRCKIIETLNEKELKTCLEEMDRDDAIVMLSQLSTSSVKKIDKRLASNAFWAKVQSNLSYSPGSVGRLLRTPVVVPSDWKTGEVLDFFRKQSLPLHFDQIYVMDGDAIRGVVESSHLLSSSKEKKIRDIMRSLKTTIPSHTTFENALLVLRKYALTGAPVVGDMQQILGVINIEDIISCVDSKTIVGQPASASDNIFSSFWGALHSRFWWLLVNLFTAILASLVVAFFEDTIKAMIALAVLMPIVASTGGNAATQTLSVTIRGLATHQISRLNAFRAIFREVSLGTLNGLVLGVLTGTMAYLWFQNLYLGAVIAGATVINMIVSGLAGILIPLFLKFVRIDPAVASGVLVTTVTDVVGFWAFLGMAAFFLI